MLNSGSPYHAPSVRSYMAVTFGLTFVATRGDQTNVARYPNIEFLVHNFALWLGNLFFFFFALVGGIRSAVQRAHECAIDTSHHMQYESHKNTMGFQCQLCERVCCDCFSGGYGRRRTSTSVAIVCLINGWHLFGHSLLVRRLNAIYQTITCD